MSKEYDPFMHTAEHVLNQTMVRMFGCGRSFSSHLNADKSKCDYHFPRPLEDAEVRNFIPFNYLQNMFFRQGNFLITLTDTKFKCFQCHFFSLTCFYLNIGTVFTPCGIMLTV